MSHFDWSSLAWVLLQAMAPLLLAAVVALCAKLTQLIHAKVKNAYLAGALVKLNDLVLTVVQALNQTFVNDTKAANGGQLSATQ